jgi:AbrB family looped-hinge helix DNA binding protein
LEVAVTRYNAKLTSKGQITIPVAVRRLLNAHAGDWMVFEVAEDGTVRLRLDDYPNLDAIQGAAGSLERPLSIAERPTVLRALEIFETTTVDFEDAMLVASMEQANIQQLYGYDRDFDRFATVRRREP